jgi:hypothetical protein
MSVDTQFASAINVQVEVMKNWLTMIKVSDALIYVVFV